MNEQELQNKAALNKEFRKRVERKNQEIQQNKVLTRREIESREEKKRFNEMFSLDCE